MVLTINIYYQILSTMVEMIIIFVQLILVSQLIVYFKFSLQKKNLSIDWKCLLNWEKKEKQMSNPFLCIQKQLEL